MKKELKGFICGAVTTSALLCGGAFAAGKWATIDVLQDDITVIVDGEQVTESNFVYNDRTYLPLRAVAEAVGKPVEYDEAANTAYIGSKTGQKADSTSEPNEIITKEPENAIPNISYDRSFTLTHSLSTGTIYRKTKINSFEITDISPTYSEQLKVSYKISGVVEENSLLMLKVVCYDVDDFIVGTDFISSNVSEGEAFKFTNSIRIPNNTVRIEFKDE